MTIRRAVVTAGGIAVVLGLAACSGGAADSGATEGTLEFSHDKPDWAFEAMSDIAADEIGITLDPSEYSDVPAYEAFIRQSFRTAENPGLFSWHTGGSLQELAEAGLVAETTDIWDEAIDNGDIAESLRDLYTIDGRQYCTPLNVADWVMYYNTAVFDEYGIAEPTTWEEMIAAADTLRQNGITPFWNQSGLWSFVWFQTILAGMDLDAYNGLATGETSFTDPAVVEAADYWLELIEDGYFSSPGSQDPAEGLLADGSVAMVPNGTWWTAALGEADLEYGSDYDFFVIPGIDPAAPTPVAIESAPFCTGEDSEQRAMGQAFAQWWLSEDAQTEWAALQNDVPLNPKAQSPNDETNELVAQLDSDDYTLYSRFYEHVPTPVLTSATDQFSAFLTNPSDPEPFLQIIQEDADEYWADQ